MAIIVKEHFDSRLITIGRTARAELRYIIYSDPPSSFDEIQAKDALLSVAPELFDPYGGGYFLLPRQSVELYPIGYHIWDARVTYAQVVTDDMSVSSFDTGGGTQHIVASIQTVGRYGPKKSTATGNMIGATKDGVEGVDIVVPTYQFVETHYFKNEDVTPTYRGDLFRLTGKVNDGSFRGLARGECLFLGASGARRGEGDWEITFKFAGSPNRENIQIGEIAGISKRGWEYLWITVEDNVDESAHTLIKRPVAVYVEQVYEEGNFSVLRI